MIKKCSWRERQTKFFCNLNKKRLEKAQFEELHKVEKRRNEEEGIRIVTEQKSIECEVRKFYWKLYQKEEKAFDKEEILRNIAEVKKVCTEDKENMDRKMSGDEVSNTLKKK